MYTPVASKIFRALRPCDNFEDIGKACMPEDYTIVCGTIEHATVVAVAYVMLGVYCLGIPLFYLILLWPKRHDMKRQYELVSINFKPRTSVTERELDELDEKLQSVYVLYQSYWYWW